MPTEPFSIVIPSQSRVDLLKLCLHSVQRHAPAGTEVIVVDDGSKGGCVSRMAETFGVGCIRFNTPRHFCAAANAGVVASRYEMVELLNDDAEVTEDWWRKPLHHFQNAQVAAVTPLILMNQPSGIRIDSAGDEYDVGGFASKRLHSLRIPNDHGQGANPENAPLRSRLVDSVSACAAFYRKKAIFEVGLFPEAFGAYFDDVDLSLRLRHAGYQLCFEADSIVWHRGSSSYGRKPTRKLVELQSRNEEWLYWRNNRSLKTLPRHAAVLAGKAFKRMEEGMLGPWLAGRLRAMAFRSSPPSRSVRTCPAPSPVQSNGSQPTVSA